jgi:hypothetical protein
MVHVVRPECGRRRGKPGTGRGFACRERGQNSGGGKCAKPADMGAKVATKRSSGASAAIV